MSRSLKELLALSPPKIHYYIKPEILAYGGSLFIYGLPGTWKSWLVIDLAFCLTQGYTWLQYPTSQAKILIIQSEQVETIYKERIEFYVKARPELDINKVDKFIQFESDQNYRLDNISGLFKLESELKIYKPDVVIIDCLYRSVDADNGQSTDLFLGRLTRFQRELGIAFVIVHHPHQIQKDREGTTIDLGFDDMSGRTNYSRWADSILKVSYIDESAHILNLQFQKIKNDRGATNKHLKVMVDTNKLVFNLI